MRCNLSCSFCDTTYRHQKDSEELTLEEWLDIINQSVHNGVRQFFVLGGGEPFVKRGILDILRTIKSHHCYGMLTTNGSLIDTATSDALLDMKWDEFHFSIDGDNPLTHDTLRGQQGSFKKAVQSACRLSTHSKNFRPHIVIHTVITNQNHTQLGGIIKLAYALKAKRVDFDSLIAYRPEQQSLLLSPSQESQLQQEAHKALILAQELGIETTLENFVHKQRVQRGNTLPQASSEKGMKGAPCLKPWHHLVIGHNGRTSPCCVLSGEGPSIKGQSFLDFWHTSSYFTDLRTSMYQHTPTARCKECSWNILRHEQEIRNHIQQSEWNAHQHKS